MAMNQNPDVKRMAQRSLFPQPVPLELPIDKQNELQAAIAELLLTVLTEDSMQEEAHIDDDQ